MPIDTQRMKEYVASIDLDGLPRPILSMDAASDAGEVFDKAKQQAQIVGSGIFSFATGVDAEVRKAISDSALLAQLVANKRTDGEADPLGWLKIYSDVLTNVGWTLQDKAWNDYTSSGNAAEVHEKILEVMTAALGPAPATLLILAATIKALKAMDPKSSWLQIFSRESQHARIARFQVGLVETAPQGDVFVSLLACLVQSDQTITQVLFFKYRQAHATFQGAFNKVSINRDALAELHSEIVQKTRVYQHSFLSSIEDL